MRACSDDDDDDDNDDNDDSDEDDDRCSTRHYWRLKNRAALVRRGSYISEAGVMPCTWSPAVGRVLD
jgi:hypothetical protein